MDFLADFADFFAAPVFFGVALDAVFLAADAFLAGAFAADVFFAGAFLTAAFFAGAFFAVAFLAGDFLAAAFFASGLMSWFSSALAGRGVEEVLQCRTGIQHVGLAHQFLPTVQNFPHIRTDASREVKHFHWRSVLVGATVLLTATACGENRPRENVQPPQPGIPARASDVQGIYRTIHQGVLQLRGNGAFVLIVPEGPGATSGDYSLLDGKFTVQTANCGETVGEYDLVVRGEPLPDKATLHFTAVRDDCAQRRHYLTIDPWVYAVS